MSIKVNEVTKIYGSQKALDAVSFEIKTGEIVGFLGPNGAGKSTMMKIITAYIPATSGQVLVNNTDIYDQNIDTRKFIGYLPENNPLYLDMYVVEYLRYVAGIYKIKQNRDIKIKEIIERTGLEIEMKKKIGALSKGYRQRVGLAQALLHNPDVLILDEPTSGLDPNQIIEIRNLIAEVGKEKTVLLSTHIMQEVEAICNSVIIINNGKIVANDQTRKLQEKSSENSQTVLVEFNKKIDSSKLQKLKGITKIKPISGNSWLIEASNDKDIREDIFNYAVKNKITVLSLQKQEKSLEQVFQELTTKKN